MRSRYTTGRILLHEDVQELNHFCRVLGRGIEMRDLIRGQFEAAVTISDPLLV